MLVDSNVNPLSVMQSLADSANPSALCPDHLGSRQGEAWNEYDSYDDVPTCPATAIQSPIEQHLHGPSAGQSSAIVSIGGFSKSSIHAAGAAQLATDTSYEEWIIKFNENWDERVAPMKRRFNNPALNLRLDALRDLIGPEWAKDNDIRTISTKEVSKWAKKLKKADSLSEMLSTLVKIELKVAEKLSRAQPQP